jgi:hypothetical protein
MYFAIYFFSKTIKYIPIGNKIIIDNSNKIVGDLRFSGYEGK